MAFLSIHRQPLQHMKPRKLIRLIASPRTAPRARSTRPDYTTESGIARRIAERRGLGSGGEYKPWIGVPEFHSRGYRRMVWSHRLQRIVHLLSELEWQVFLVLEADPRNIEIKENYPLPREETRLIASRLGIPHPSPYGTDIVMTTDFLITQQTPSGPRLVAWTAKYEQELSKPRVREKLAIEEAYYQSLPTPVPFHIVTERSVPDTLVDNLEYLRGTLHPTAMEGYSRQTIDDVDTRLRPILGCGSLGALCGECDAQLNLEPGSSLRIVRYLIATRRWPVDLTVPIAPDRTLLLEVKK